MCNSLEVLLDDGDHERQVADFVGYFADAETLVRVEYLLDLGLTVEQYGLVQQFATNRFLYTKVLEE